MNPLVSICVPAYRADEFLAATLESVKAQTYPDWELIVVEDGSADRTENLVRAFAETVTQKVFYVRHAQNLGLAATRNTGIGKARGEWIAFLDADDLWLPAHLESLVAAAEKAGASVACSGAVAFASTTGEALYEIPQREEWVAQFPRSIYRGEMVILPSAAMISRETLLLHGSVNTAYRMCNDTELWFRLSSAGVHFAFTRQTTCRYRRHLNSMSQMQTANLEELGKLYEEYSDWPAISWMERRGKAASLYRYAARAQLKEDPRRARTLLLKSLRRDFFRGSTWYFLAKAVIRPSRAV